MNYIKKKIKGHHKKGHDEDEDFDLEPVSVPPYPGPGVPSDDSAAAPAPYVPFAPDRATERAERAENKTSEEWQFFQQLTQRVQDTVQKTQSSLNKIKDSSALDEISKPDYEFSQAQEAESRAQLVSASWVNFEDGKGGGSGGDTAEDTPDSKKPGRPPPPRPARPPPPPTIISAAHPNVEEDPINILEEFGFQREPASNQIIPNGNVHSLLITGEDETEPVAEEEGDDPFDTSFVNQSVISAAKSPTNTYTDLLGTSEAEDTLFYQGNTPKSASINLLEATLDNNTNKAATVIQSDFGTFTSDVTGLYQEEDTSGQPDPFDTSFVDALTEKNSPVEKVKSPPTSNPTDTDEMSNPFLTDDPGLLDLCSTGSTPPPRPPPPAERKRKMSTNPFEMTDLLEDFILEGSSTAPSTQPIPTNNAYDFLQDPVPSFPQNVSSSFGQDTSPFGPEVSNMFGQDVSSGFAQERSVFDQDVSTAFGLESSPFGQEPPPNSNINKEHSPFGQVSTAFGQEASPFGPEVSTTFGQEASPFGQDVSATFGQENSQFGQTIPSSFGKDVSPFDQGVSAFGQGSPTIGQEGTPHRKDSSPFRQEASGFGQEISTNFGEDFSAFGNEVGEVQKSSLPFDLSPKPETTGPGPVSSSDPFDPFGSQHPDPFASQQSEPFASQQSDFPSVPFSSDQSGGQSADDLFQAEEEAQDAFPTGPSMTQPKIDPAVRNVINTLEKLASFAAADDVGPPESPTSSNLFPGASSKEDGGTGDSTPHALDFAEIEAKDGHEVDDITSNEVHVSDQAPNWPDNPFGEDETASVKPSQNETAQAFAESFLFGGPDMEPPVMSDLNGDPFGDQSHVQVKSSFGSAQNFDSSIGQPQQDPFGSTEQRNSSFGTDNKNDFFEGSLKPTGATTFQPPKSQLDGFSTGNIQDSMDPFGANIGNSANDFFSALGDKGSDPFDSSKSKDSNDPFGFSVQQAGDSLNKDSDPFSTSNIGDPFSVPPDVTNLLSSGGGGATTDAFNFEPVKDSLPFTDTAAFEAFAAKFEQAIEKLDDNVPPPCIQGDIFDPFGGGTVTGPSAVLGNTDGFGTGMDIFDPFKAMSAPTIAEAVTPKTLSKYKAKKAAKLIQSDSQDSFDDDDDLDFSVVIRPKMREATEGVPTSSLGPPPLLPPPPKSPARSASPPQPANRFNPFNRDFGFSSTQEPDVSDEIPLSVASAPEPKDKSLGILLGLDREPPPALGEAGAVKRTDSQESPSTPLFDDDTSQPLEDFLPKFSSDGWDMMLRQPSKKKITGNRYWKKVYVRLSENSVLQLYNKHEDNEPFQELPLQACYSLSEVGAQQYDNYGKIFTVKLHYIFYRERVGVRPGQIHKVMAGQFTSVGQIAKLGLPLEHAPQVSQLLKIGTQTYAEIKTFIQVMEDTLFHLSVHRDRALTYKTEEIQVTVVDELIVDQRKDGHVLKQRARVRLFFLAFMTGMPDVEVGLNDLLREGKEVVGRYDIIPVVTEEWIRIENGDFHCCVVQEEFNRTRIIKLLPPDACLFELMRFRIRPPKNRELPLQVKASMRVNDNRVELRADVLVPGYHSRKHGQVPCEDIQIRFPIPECWIYLFRVEKHFRYGSLKSAARKPGKIKGLERIMGTAQSLDPSLIEVSTGQAKYEHAFKAVVWRIPRLPKEGQGAYTTQLLLIKLDLTSFDQIPESFEKYVHVEFGMPATTVSHTTVRSISVSNDNPPEKYVKYSAKHEYRVEIDMGHGPGDPLDYEAVVASVGSNATPPAKAPSTVGLSQHSEEDDSD